MDPQEHCLALCVGHSRLIRGRIEGGALSPTGENEYTFNCDQAARLAEILHDGHGITAVVIDRYEKGANYGDAMRWLGGELRGMPEVGLAVELHFNAGGGTGHEWLHWHTSPRGMRAAMELHMAMAKNYGNGELPPRGVKPRRASDRGAGFLLHTPCPAVICEPFFGDSARDWALVSSEAGRARHARTMALGLANAFQAL